MGLAGTAAIAGGLVASPIVLLSAYYLATTGEGLPPGPGGAYGAAGTRSLPYVSCTIQCVASTPRMFNPGLCACQSSFCVHTVKGPKMAVQCLGMMTMPSLTTRASANALLCVAEGVSYLAILAIIGWSAYTKVSTGSGLPAGPSGLLGAAEGFSYLALLGAIVAFAVKTFS